MGDIRGSKIHASEDRVGAWHLRVKWLRLTRRTDNVLLTLAMILPCVDNCDCVQCNCSLADTDDLIQDSLHGTQFSLVRC